MRSSLALIRSSLRRSLRLPNMVAGTQYSRTHTQTRAHIVIEMLTSRQCIACKMTECIMKNVLFVRFECALESDRDGDRCIQVMSKSAADGAALPPPKSFYEWSLLVASLLIHVHGLIGHSYLFSKFLFCSLLLCICRFDAFIHFLYLSISIRWAH